MDGSIRPSFIVVDDLVNGHRSLLLSGLRNHYWHEVAETVGWLAERSHASYGAVHLNDHARHNRVGASVVLTLRRGPVEEHDDPVHLM